MFGLFKKAAQEKKTESPKEEEKIALDKNILRKNNVSILILDERWNNLFVNTEKSTEILKLENDLRELLKEQARLSTEAKDITHRKKNHMDKIIHLTTEAFEKDNEDARNEMQVCQKEIMQINDRIGEIQQDIDSIPERIKQTNLDLLEKTINLFYFNMRDNQDRVKELDQLIVETREKIKQYIDEKESLSQDYHNIYTYFHDLLGREQLEKLDKQYFSENSKKV